MTASQTYISAVDGTQKPADYFVTRFSDGGHSWLRVRREECARLGVIPSRFSYMDDTCFYLEEDEDMWAYLDARFGTGDGRKNAREWLAAQYTHHCSLNDMEHPVRSLDHVL